MFTPWHDAHGGGEQIITGKNAHACRTVNGDQPWVALPSHAYCRDLIFPYGADRPCPHSGIRVALDSRGMEGPGAPREAALRLSSLDRLGAAALFAPPCTSQVRRGGNLREGYRAGGEGKSPLCAAPVQGRLGFLRCPADFARWA